MKVTGTVTIRMEAGRSYFLRGLMKEGAGGDRFKIGMRKADGSSEYFPIGSAQLGSSPTPVTLVAISGDGCEQSGFSSITSTEDCRMACHSVGLSFDHVTSNDRPYGCSKEPNRITLTQHPFNGEVVSASDEGKCFWNAEP